MLKRSGDVSDGGMPTMYVREHPDTVSSMCVPPGGGACPVGCRVHRGEATEFDSITRCCRTCGHHAVNHNPAPGFPDKRVDTDHPDTVELNRLRQGPKYSCSR